MTAFDRYEGKSQKKNLIKRNIVIFIDIRLANFMFHPNRSLNSMQFKLEIHINCNYISFFRKIPIKQIQFQSL